MGRAQKTKKKTEVKEKVQCKGKGKGPEEDKKILDDRLEEPCAVIDTRDKSGGAISNSRNVEKKRKHGQNSVQSSEVERETAGTAAMSQAEEIQRRYNGMTFNDSHASDKKDWLSEMVLFQKIFHNFMH